MVKFKYISRNLITQNDRDKTRNPYHQFSKNILLYVFNTSVVLFPSFMSFFSMYASSLFRPMGIGRERLLTAPAGRFSVKFDIGDFHENLTKRAKFCSNLTKILGTLHEDLFMFFYGISKYFVARQQCTRKPLHLTIYILSDIYGSTTIRMECIVACSS